MNNKMGGQGRRNLGAALLLLLLLPASGAALAAEPVAASARATQETLDNTALRAIFTLRKRRWTSDGRPVRVFVLQDDNPLHKTFVRDKLKMFPYQLRQHWNRVIFSGTGTAPQDFEEEEDMLRALASTPDAIGYSDNENLPEGVDVIVVTP